MSSGSITPALTRAEWAGVLANRAQLAEIREQFLDTPFSGHALAALLLFEEDFGFSAQTHFLKGFGQAAWYRPLTARSQLAFSGRIGAIEPLLPITDPGGIGPENVALARPGWIRSGFDHVTPPSRVYLSASQCVLMSTYAR